MSPLLLESNSRPATLEASRARAAGPGARARSEELLRVIAHELRSPLTTIRLGLSTLERNASPGARLRTIAMIDRQVDLLVRLTDDLANGALLTHDRVDVRLNRVDVREALAIALETGRPAIQAADHTLAVRMPDGPLEIEVDQDRFTQIIANLLGNAAKYSEPGGRIEVSAAADGANVLIRVADSGDGLPPDVLEEIFEPFVRARQSSRGKRQGLGIGLAVVRRLVEEHGGAVWAESDGPGKGTTFIIRLPLAEGPGS